MSEDTPPEPLPPAARFRPRPDVLVRDLDGESVLLDLGSGHYFGLNGSGRRIWGLLSDGSSIAETLDALEAEFAVPRAVLASDLEELVRALESAGLVERDG